MAFVRLFEYNGIYVAEDDSTYTLHDVTAFAPLGYSFADTGTLAVDMTNATTAIYSADRAATVYTGRTRLKWQANRGSSYVTGVNSATDLGLVENKLYSVVSNIPDSKISVTTNPSGNTIVNVFIDTETEITVSLTEASGTEITETLTFNGLFHIGSWHKINSSKTITVTAAAVPTELSVTNNVSNSEYSYSGGNPYDFTLTANDGYIFKSAPTAAYTGTSGESVSSEFVLSSDGKTATLENVSISSENLSVVFSGETEEETFTPTFTNNIAHSSFVWSGGTHQYTVKITADDGYIFDGEITAEYTGYSTGTTVSATFAVDEYKKKASCVCPDVDERAVITLKGTTTKEYAAVTKNLTNCTVDVADKVKIGDEITITLTSNENAAFSGTVPKIYYLEGGVPTTFDFTVTTDKKTATITYTPDRDFTINAVAYTVEPVGTSYGSINVYLVTVENLDSFSKKRFFRETQTDESIEQIDLGIYVNRIKRVFVNVQDNGEDTIKCGNYNTGITCKIPKSDIVALDFGDLNIPAVNGDIHDYSSTLQMFVPFVGLVSLDSSFIGKAINLSYKVNIVTGDGIAVISYDGTPFMIHDVSVCRDVLYKTGRYTLQTIGGGSFDEKSMYGLKPYVLMRYTLTHQLTQQTARTDVIIGEISGLSKFDDVNVDVNCLADEQSEIQNLLSTGVIL